MNACSVLTKEQLKYIRFIRTKAHKEYKSKSVCDIVSEFLYKKYGWPQKIGRYRGVRHFWNIHPNGMKLCCTHDQFDDTPITFID